MENPAKLLRFERSENLTLVAESWGDPEAPAVIMLHGGGQTRHAWGNTAKGLAEKGWHAIALDHRGHGESDWDPEGNYRLEAFVSDLMAVSSQLDKPVAIVGASLGGLTALLATGEENLSALAIVLVDIAPRLEQSGMKRISEFMLSGSDGFESLEEVAELIAKYTPERKRKTNLQSLEKNLRKGEDGRYHWHWDPRFMSATGPKELRDRDRLFRAARNLSAPTLIVRGQKSDVVSLEGAREFLSLVPHAEFYDVSQAGHMVAGDRNDLFSQVIIEFLDKHR